MEGTAAQNPPADPPGAPPASAAEPKSPPGAPKKESLMSRLKGAWSEMGEHLKDIEMGRMGSGAGDGDNVSSNETRRLPKPFVEMQNGKKRAPRVLFVDSGNAVRSQVAEAIARSYHMHAESAGTFPLTGIPNETVTICKEWGLDLNGKIPKLFDVNRLESFDRVIVMEANVPRTTTAGPNIEDWEILDATGQPMHVYKEMEKQLESRIRRLARSFTYKKKRRHTVRWVQVADKPV